MLKLVSSWGRVGDKFGGSLNSSARNFLSKFFTRASTDDIIVPTIFENDVRQSFEKARKNPSKNVFLVWTEENNSYKFGGIDHGKNPWNYIHRLEDRGLHVIIALDLKKSFQSQWPATQIFSPDALKDYPIIEIPHERDIDTICISNPHGHGKRPVPPFIRGIVINPQKTLA